MENSSPSPSPETPDTRPTGAHRRALLARGNRLKAGLRVGRNGVTDAVIDELRRMFDTSALIKVRVDAEDKAEVNAVAEEICRRAGCAFIQRVGRVVLLYHPQAEDHSRTEESS